jgi:hypothetical protein
MSNKFNMVSHTFWAIQTYPLQRGLYFDPKIFIVCLLVVTCSGCPCSVREGARKMTGVHVLWTAIRCKVALLEIKFVCQLYVAIQTKSQELKRWRGICRFRCFSQSIGPKSVNGPGNIYTTKDPHLLQMDFPHRKCFYRMIEIKIRTISDQSIKNRDDRFATEKPIFEQ